MGHADVIGNVVDAMRTIAGPETRLWDIADIVKLIEEWETT
jgi:hypothetical protein